MKKGYYDGNIVRNFETENKELCGDGCCANNECDLWVWRSRDKRCHHKKDVCVLGDCAFHSDPTHSTAKKCNYLCY